MLKTTLKALLFTLVTFMSVAIISHFIGKGNVGIATPVQEILLIIFSIGLIKYQKIDFRIKLPEPKKALQVFFISFFAGISVMIITQLSMKFLLGETMHKEVHPLLKQLSGWEIFIYVFILASIAEELLFRGYLLNALSKLDITYIGKLKLSVLISALAFACLHLGLLRAGATPKFVAVIFIFTLSIGLIAGYFQKKYDNNVAYAILAHMGANFISILTIILMHMAGIQM